MDMAHAMFEMLWLVGIIVSLSALLYGAWLVYLLQSTASDVNQHTIARLGLHDAPPPNQDLGFIKEAALAEPSRSAMRLRRSAQQSPARRVLVVDDNADAVDSMVRLITMMGHDCASAMNGFSALEVARQFRPNIVLLDIALPGLNGWNLAKQLRREPALKGAYIVAITALPDADRQRMADAGCDEFYRKPLDPMVLQQLLADPLRSDQKEAA